MIVRSSPQNPDVWLGVDGGKPSSIEDLPPGSHVILLSVRPTDGILGRRLGLEVRDTLLILSPKGTSFAFLLRKEVEGTVAENVLRYGTGALNIDATRVRTADNLNGGAYSGELRWRDNYASSDALANAALTRLGRGIGEYTPPIGRWPSNLVLVHGHGCKRTGTKKIKAITGTLNGSWRKGHQYDGGYVGADEADLGKPVGYGGEDGMESIAAWECQAGCPVSELDGMSGTLTSGNLSSGHKQGIGGTVHKGRIGNVIEREYGGDSGGASRFYPQFASEPELLGWIQTLLGVNT
jgi:hypothetical protein